MMYQSWTSYQASGRKEITITKCKEGGGNNGITSLLHPSSKIWTRGILIKGKGYIDKGQGLPYEK